MEIPEICISFIVGIVGLAYPILLEVISRLDDKYSSVLIIELFNTEKKKKRFVNSLKIALVCVVIYIVRQPRVVDAGVFNWVIEHSAEGLLLVTTGVLIVFFLML